VKERLSTRNLTQFLLGDTKSMQNLMDKSIKNKMSENLENHLGTEGLLELHQEMLKETDSFIYDDFKFCTENYINNNFLFDPLNGSFKEIVYGTTMGQKEVTMKHNNDLPLGTKNSWRKDKIRNNPKSNELEGNSQLKSEKDIDEKVLEWAKVIETTEADLKENSENYKKLDNFEEYDLLFEAFNFREPGSSTDKIQRNPASQRDDHEFWSIFARKVKSSLKKVKIRIGKSYKFRP